MYVQHCLAAKSLPAKQHITMDSSYTPSCTASSSSSTSVTSTVSTYGSSVGGAHATTPHHSLAPVNNADSSASSSSGPLDYHAAVDLSFRRHSDLYLQQQSQNDPRTQNTVEMNYGGKQSSTGVDSTSTSRYGSVASTPSPISQPPSSPMHPPPMMYSQTQGPFYFNVPSNTVAGGLTICDSGSGDTQNEDVFLNGDAATTNQTLSSVSVTSTVGDGNIYLQPSLQGYGQQYGNYVNLPPCRRGSAISNPDHFTSNPENNYPYSVNATTTQQATTPTEPIPNSTNNNFNTDTNVSQVPGAVPPGSVYPSNSSNQPLELASEDHDLVVPNLPRRSSIIKNGNRKSQRKKTVSFSSMPTEKTITTGEYIYIFFPVLYIYNA